MNDAKWFKKKKVIEVLGDLSKFSEKAGIAGAVLGSAFSIVTLITGGEPSMQDLVDKMDEIIAKIDELESKIDD